jgi:PAS domain S-box-containing protein
MKDEEKTRAQLLDELESMRRQIVTLQTMQLSREQRLKLAILERVPFTMWACDRDFKIILWGGKCEDLYGYSLDQAVGKNYLQLFVDPPERKQSREDCLKIIDEGMVQKNCLAYDKAKDGSQRYMLTNCFRIFDEQAQAYLQAEVALEISDLQLKAEELRTLREAGIKWQTQIERSVEIKKRELFSRIDAANSSKFNLIMRRQTEIDDYHDKVRVDFGESQAEKLTAPYSLDIKNARRHLEEECKDLRDAVEKAETYGELDHINEAVSLFERKGVVKSGPPSTT